MDFRTLGQIIAFRWRIVVAAILACLVGAATITALQTKMYQVRGPGLGAAAVEGRTDDPAGGTGSARVFTGSNVAGGDMSRGKMLCL